MTHPSAMPEWPSDFSLYEACDVLDYERALRLAWEARARVAVEKLQKFNNYECNCDSCSSIRSVLTLIGPLPPLPADDSTRGA